MLINTLAAAQREGFFNSETWAAIIGATIGGVFALVGEVYRDIAHTNDRLDDLSDSYGEMKMMSQVEATLQQTGIYYYREVAVKSLQGVKESVTKLKQIVDRKLTDSKQPL